MSLVALLQAKKGISFRGSAVANEAKIARSSAGLATKNTMKNSYIHLSQRKINAFAKLIFSRM